jgi:hypothetical protein
MESFNSSFSFISTDDEDLNVFIVKLKGVPIARFNIPEPHYVNLAQLRKLK